jgi:hypothetical protein
MSPCPAVGKSTHHPSGSSRSSSADRWQPSQAADADRSRLVAPLPAHDRGAGSLKVKSAYLDGELCALNADGVTRSSSTSEVLLHSHLASAGAAIACSVAVINRRTPSAPTFEEAPGWRRSHLRPRDAYSVRRVQLGARRKERHGRYSEQRPSAHAQMRLLHWCRPLLPN